MRTLVRYTIASILRSPGILVWTLAFPLILSTAFFFMFDGIEESAAAHDVTVAVVENDRLREDTAFADFLAQAQNAEGSLLDVRFVAGEDEARQAVDEGGACASVMLDADGTPRLTVGDGEVDTTDLSIVRAILDRYAQGRSQAELLAEAAATGTANVDATVAADAFSGEHVSTEEASVLRVEPDGYSRYYYALIGMASLMGANIALNMVSGVRANCSRLGARRQASAVPPSRQMAATVVASWACIFACLVVAFLYTRFALGVEYGARDGLAYVALAACALLATGLGALFGALPRLSSDAKNGVSTALACMLSIGAGLYGEPSLRLADWLADNIPLAQLVNPASQVSQVFYDLAFYDSLTPFFGTLAVIGVMAAVFFAAAGALMRRQQYERL